LLKALAKRPGERFTSCMDFIAALEGKIKFTPRRRSKPPVVKRNVKKSQRYQVVLLSLLMIFALGSGFFFIMRPAKTTPNGNEKSGTMGSSSQPSNKVMVITAEEGKDFITKTWLSAWKSGQIGPYSKCYNNDTFVGHNYTARNSYTTLTFDAYLSQWLAITKSNNTQITNLETKKLDDMHLVATFLFNTGATTSRMRITLEKSSDDSITITHDDTSPKDISLDGLE